MIKQPLNKVTAALLIIYFFFTEGKESVQKLTSINMYELIKMLGKSTTVRSAGAKLKRKERSFSTQLISQEKFLPWRLTVLRETDLSGLCTAAP